MANCISDDTNQTNGRQVGEPQPDDDWQNETIKSEGSDFQADFAAQQSKKSATAAWQIPRGVSPGTWDYVRGDRIANHYDQFLQNDPLTAVDRKILDRYLPPQIATNQTRQSKGSLVADLGCGAGRHSIQLAERGYRVLAVDLSLPMLRQLAKKVSANEQKSCAGNVWAAQCNLVELDGFHTDSVHHAICMFSTLGMINGRQNRRQFLEHVRRLIKPGGQFILHVHNLWFQIRHPGGMRWIMSNAVSSLRGRSEFGDRFANYRGLKNMFIHSFRRRELQQDLNKAGFEDLEWIGIKPNDHSQQNDPGYKTDLRWRDTLGLVGWIVIAR